MKGGTKRGTIDLVQQETRQCCQHTRLGTAGKREREGGSPSWCARARFPTPACAVVWQTVRRRARRPERINNSFTCLIRIIVVVFGVIRVFVGCSECCLPAMDREETAGLSSSPSEFISRLFLLTRLLPLAVRRSLQ